MTASTSLDSFKYRRTLKVGNKTYDYFSLKAAEKNGPKNISKLPFSLKVLLENLLRHEDGRTVKEADIKAMAAWVTKRSSKREIAFRLGVGANAAEAGDLVQRFRGPASAHGRSVRIVSPKRMGVSVGAAAPGRHTGGTPACASRMTSHGGELRRTAPC